MVAVARIWSKNFSAAPSSILFGLVQSVSITAFHVDTAPTLYLMVVLAGGGF